jgi:hypothetical protein
MKTLLLSCLTAGAIVISTSARADEPTAPLPPAPTKAAAESADTPLVDLSADSNQATLERRMATTAPTLSVFDTGALGIGQWQHVCAAPCASRLDSRYTYRVAGDGLVPSDSFTLPRGQERVRVDARMGSALGRGLGIVGTVGGVLALGAGALALGATPILESQDVGSKGFRTGVLVGGIGAVSVGVVSTIVGVYLWMSNGSNARAAGEPVRAATR